MHPTGGLRPRFLAPASRGTSAGTILIFCLIGGASPAVGQSSQHLEFTRSAETRVFAANALLGGVSAGLAALVRGDPLLPAVGSGLGGGALVYVGKRIAVDPLPMTGLVGRQVASVGGSIIGNRVAGRGSLDRVAFAVGPLRAYVGHRVPGVHWRVDAVATVAAVWGLAGPGEIDVMKSISHGAVVVQGSAEQALPGTIFYHRKASPERQAYVLAHEQVHILQYDQSFLSWGGPYEELIGRQHPVLGGVLDRAEFNLPILASALLLALLVWEQHDEQPWEKEAMYLGRTR